ncbi:RimK family alpha-L-glutamate ligase [Methylocystis sp. Sn-Cys]|uniref:ATP-grasp domain-containing protein n=1 Tax=Methylocystis sp. Sn-Cys TaxID=1701263 RepID=UPI001921DCAC|nr:hypothetical protein [Methylocystis sp. Sn-Cys]MBL1257127.1 hypothetical protein [Methylocystis sp. Sn-Cys]
MTRFVGGLESEPECAAPILGLATIARMVANGRDLEPLKTELLQKTARSDAGALFDLSIIERLSGNFESANRFQAAALQRGRRFQPPLAPKAIDPLRVLALAAPGDFMSNTPIEFLVESREVALETLYLSPDDDFPSALPEHDVIFVAVAEMDANQTILEKIDGAMRASARKLVNQPSLIARLTRDGAWSLLHDAPGVSFPANARVDRERLVAMAKGEAPVHYPIIARPVGSHAGDGLRKIESAEAILAFLDEQSASQFYVAPFVDYRSGDGLFRKYRIVMIEGVPYAVHMAISKNWMVHYLNADMFDSEANRAEEAHFMASFDAEFAQRHAVALAEAQRRTGLDYLLLDCSETRDGKLLIFEAGTAMVIHTLDSEVVFPYKRPQMEKIFDAFEKMLRAKAQKR